jgi:hypothetical protein
VICKNIQGDKEETGSKRSDQSHSNASAVLFLHVCEIKQLHDIYGKVNSILEVLQHKQYGMLQIHLNIFRLISISFSHSHSHSQMTD